MADVDDWVTPGAAPAAQNGADDWVSPPQPSVASQIGHALNPETMINSYGRFAVAGLKGAYQGAQEASDTLKSDFTTPMDENEYVPHNTGLRGELEAPFAQGIGTAAALGLRAAKIAGDVGNMVVHPLAKEASANLSGAVAAGFQATDSTLTPQQAQGMSEEFIENVANLPFMAEGGKILGHAEAPKPYAPPTVPPEPMSGPAADAYVTHSPIGAALDAFGAGPANNWGMTNITDGIDTRAAPSDALKATAQSQADVTKAFNEAFLRPAAAEALVRSGPIGAQQLAEARTFGIVGEGEDGWAGTVPPTDAQLADRVTAASYIPSEPEAVPVPDIHAIARDVAPDVFSGPNGYDALLTRQATFRRWIDELSSTRDQNFADNPPLGDQIGTVQGKIDTILGKVNGVEDRLTKTKASQLESLRDQHEDLTEQSRQIATQDTPDMQRVRGELLKNDYRMRDLSPQVSAAYREAQSRMPAEEAPTSSGVAEARPEPVSTGQAESPTALPPVEPEATPEQNTAAPVEVQVPQAATSARPVPANVAADVSQKLIAAGRPAEEANAASALIQAHYEARAARFEGAKGTGAELYAREVPEIRAGRVRAASAAKIREFAQSKEYLQSARNDISDVLDAAAKPGISNAKAKIGAASEWLVGQAHDAGVNISGYNHAVDASAIRHIKKAHGNPDTETARGQVAVTDADISNIPSLLDAPDKVLFGMKNSRGQDIVGYLKSMADGSTLYLEEVRSGRKELATTSMRKYPAAMNVDALTSTLDLNAKRDGGTGLKIVTPGEGVTTLDGRKYDQSARGKISFRDAQSTITLMKDANASTFIHETGHQWLEELMRDASDERAPPDLTKDAQTVRDYLGVKEGEEISTRQHEKFARSFERYMMEGNAPSKALADVFAKFKDWLTKIYETVTKLRAPINDDIRDVFDRLLTKPGDEAVIAPDHEPGKGFADIHEADAEHTPPEHADPVGDVVEKEIVQVAEVKKPDVADELTNGGETGGIPAEAGSDSGSDSEAGPIAGRPGATEEPGAITEGGSNAEGEGADIRTESGANGGNTDASAGGESEPDQFVQSNVNLIDKAGNIRLDNLNMPEDVDAALRQIAAENDDFNAQRFGAAGRQLHDIILAARKLTAQASYEMAEARSKAALDTATDKDLIAYRDASNRLTMIASRLATLTHDWGYAGQAFRMLEGLPDTATTTSMAQLAERTKGMTLFQLKREAQLGEQLETPAQQQKFLMDARLTNWQRAQSMIIELFVNNLISGPITHLAYSIGTRSAALFRAVPVTAVQAAISTIKGAEAGERVYFGEMGAQLWGHIISTPDAWSAAAKAWKTGIAEPLPGALEAMTDEQKTAFENRGPNEGAIPGRIGRIIRLPSDSVAAIHSFNSVAAYTQELWRLAYRSASDAGLSGDAHADHMAQFIENPSDEAMEAARTEGISNVLMNPAKYGGDFYKFKQLVNNNLALKLIAPFMQIGANILHEAFLEHTPLGYLDPTIRDNLRGVNGEMAKTLQQGKISTGIILGGAVVGLTLDGTMTGGGPTDPQKRALMMSSGWQPYSLKMGNYYVPYRKFLGPIGTLMAGVSDVTEVGHNLGEGDLANASKAAVFGLSEVVADESWFSGITNFVDAARNWDKPAGDRYFRNMATSFIPFSVGLSQIARLIDPYQRQVRDIADAARAKIPGESMELMPRRDIFGMPIASRLMVSPSYVTQDPVADLLMKTGDASGKYVRMPERQISGVKLNEQQYDEYSLLSGRLLHTALQAQIRSPGWNSIPVSQQAVVVDRIVKASRENAAIKVRSDYQGKPDDIIAQAIAKRSALSGQR